MAESTPIPATSERGTRRDHGNGALVGPGPFPTGEFHGPGADGNPEAVMPHNQKAATQARILDAAVALFSARGFDRTSIGSIAARAGVSRAAVFWHFGDKQALFQHVCKEMLLPFIEQLQQSLQHLDHRARLFELFTVYESFVAKNRHTIQTIVRWVLESPKLRASLRQPLLALHEAFARDVLESLNALMSDPAEAEALAAGLVSLLDGNLVLSLLDTDSRSQAVRGAGLRALARLAVEGKL